MSNLLDFKGPMNITNSANNTTDIYVKRISELTSKYNNHTAVSGSVNIDWSTTGNFVSMHIDGDVTITTSNMVKGAYAVVYVENDDSSNHTISIGAETITVQPGASSGKLVEVWEFKEFSILRES